MPVVQWFPGHMQKAKRLVREQIKLVDVVLELVDCRAVAATHNPDLAELTAGKPRVVVLNKADLAVPAVTQRWVEYFAAGGVAAVPVDSTTGDGVRQLTQEVRRLFAPTLANLKAKGRLPRAARCMVVGMPNVGKSSLINRLVGRNKAVTGAKPGVTRDVQWVKVAHDVQLLDTPGILLPKIADDRMGVHLAAIGAVKDEVFAAHVVAGMLLAELWELAPAQVTDRFGLERLDPEPLVNLAEVGRKRGLLQSGGVPDTDKAALLILREFRNGRLGRISLETPPAPAPAPTSVPTAGTGAVGAPGPVEQG
jgi:ribosome biogenesis GTPase A